MIFKKISLASDHAGFEMKENIKDFLSKHGLETVDFGTNSHESVDYPDFAHLLASSIEESKCDAGIAICGSGNGINMTVNKHCKIRGALCWTAEIAKLSRLHNDANVCCLPARFINNKTAIEIVYNFLSTDFEGGRHEERIRKISIDLLSNQK